MTSINKSMAVTGPNTSRSPGRTVRHIVIHYTSTTASAQDNIRYFSSGNREASADFFVNKDGSIYQYNADPNNYYTWHCGDGHGRYGITNAQSIGIENVSAGEDFTSNQINALKDLVGYLMKTYNVPAQNVVRHYDASRKLCPAPYIDQNKWNNLWRTITSGGGGVASSGSGVSWQNAPTTEAKVWCYLVGVGGITKAGAGGIMGNMAHESGVRPNRVQMGFGWTDDRYTSSTDNGSYKNFIHDSIGYGLVQFTSWNLKKYVYDKAKSMNKSVGDLEVQLISVVEQLKSGYSGLYKILSTSNDVRECTVAFLLQYERPANQSVAVQNARTARAMEFYNQFKDLDVNTMAGISGGGGGFSISYDRKDPLVMEFGYAVPATGGVGANLGTQMKAQKNVSQYTVSAVNTADLLNDIFSIWGFNPSGGGPTTDGTEFSGGQTVAGQAKTKSGKVLTSGIWKQMPAGQPQTGIVANYTGYDRKWAAGTNQRTLYDIWVSQGKPSKYSIAQISGYFLLAPGRYFSNNAGDILEVKLEGGVSFMALVGDTKGGDTRNEYGHVLGSGGAVDVIEWENVSSAQAPLTAGLKQWGIYGKKVLGMTNFGTYFQ